MKKFYKGILAAVLACCVAFTLAACGGSPDPANSGGEDQSTTSLSRYDYVADLQGNTVNMTIAQNLKSVTIEITSMKLNLTAYCTVEGNVLTLTELAEGNEQFYQGLAATPYVLNEDGTAVPVSGEEGGNDTGLSRYDYVADVKGNTVNMTIAQNLKSVTIEITSMNLKLTAYCTVEDNVLTLTELAEGNEQFYQGLAATPYVLNEDGTAVPVSGEEGGDDAGLSRYDYVADVKGNTVNMTIAQNLKSVTIEITSMNLKLTAYCTVEGNVLTLTELAEGNEQFYQGLAATPYVLSEDGTATPQS